MALPLAILGQPGFRALAATLIGLLPIWLRPKPKYPFLRALVPVLITYCLAAAGTAIIDPVKIDQRTIGLDTLLDDAGPTESLLPALLLTIGIAVVPPFLCGAFVRGVRREARSPTVGECVALGVWFGFPIMILSLHAGWFCLLAVAAHLAMARGGERLWVFVEYGSTSFALLLFLAVFGDRWYPWGLLVVLLQAPLLTLMAVWGRKLFVVESVFGKGDAAAGSGLLDMAPWRRGGRSGRRKRRNGPAAAQQERR
jgi:hypothetical protein